LCFSTGGKQASCAKSSFTRNFKINSPDWRQKIIHKIPSGSGACGCFCLWENLIVFMVCRFAGIIRMNLLWKESCAMAQRHQFRAGEKAPNNGIYIEIGEEGDGVMNPKMIKLK